MSKNRYLDTKFWTDTFIVNSDPIEKLLFIYILTNPLTNISGIYEISLKQIAFDTGIDKEMIERVFFRFEKANKLIYINGWIAITNFINYQKINPNVKIGIEESLKKVPIEVMIGFQRLSKALNYLNLNSNLNYNINNNLNLIEIGQFYEPPIKKEWIAPTKEEFNQYIITNKLNLKGDDLYKYYTEGNWYDGKGNKVKNWKQKLLVLNTYADKNKKSDTVNHALEREIAKNSGKIYDKFD